MDRGSDIILKGVNLGGWLMMEGYLTGGRNIPEHAFKRSFKDIHGSSGLVEFEHCFRDNFFRSRDCENIKDWGFNCLRVPFNARVLEKEPFVYSEEAMVYLENILDWGEKNQLKIILDLHAGSGAQNCDWHSDSDGRDLLWQSKELRERTICLWEHIISGLKDKPALYGYDLLNEPVVGPGKLSTLRGFYKELVKRVKVIDRQHILFLEGNCWAQEIDFLADLLEEKVEVSVHAYLPLEYTFNFVPYYSYPGTINNCRWDKDVLRKYIEPYYLFSRKHKVRIFVGEFGVNWRGGFYGEGRYLSDILSLFNEFGFGYTYWTYKSAKTFVFPDGIFQYVNNPGYICRQGPEFGWETYLKLWKERGEEIADSWKSENYLLNGDLLKVLKTFL